MDKPKISFETERLYVRSIEQRDKEDYMGLRVEASPMARAYEEFPEFRDREWNNELNSEDELYLIAFLKDGNIFVASSSFQNFNTDVIELGFDVKEPHRNKGIATELVNGMIRTAASVFPDTSFKIRTDVTNAACRRVAEKCGGVLTGYEPTQAARAIAVLMEKFKNEPTDDEELLQMRKKNAEFIEEYKEGG